MSALEHLLPPGVVTVEATPEMWESPLHPDEEVYVARAVPKRRREFAAGRACARAALARFGVADGPLLRDADRCPVWTRGFVGSISHCLGFCAASVARAEEVAGVGIDAEQATPLPPRLHTMVATARERERLAHLPAEDGVDWPKVLFSAKESFFKCYYPLARTMLEFAAVEVEFAPEAGAFLGRLIDPGAPLVLGRRTLRGRFAVTPSHVLTAVAIEAACT